MYAGGALVSTLAVGVKLVVMAAAAWLLVRLYGSVYPAPRRRRWVLLPDESLPEMRAVFGAVVLLAVSEATCAVELWVIFHSTVATGISHSATSIAGMALFAYAVYGYLDRKVFGFGSRACVFHRMCAACPVPQGGACRQQAFLQLLAGLVGLAALPLLFASTEPIAPDPQRWVLPFPAINAWYDHTFLPKLQLVCSLDPSGQGFPIPRWVSAFNFRIVPALAAALAVAAIVLIRLRRERAGLRLSAATLGVLAYPYLEAVAKRVTGDVTLGAIFHELAELWFLVATAVFLLRTFGRGDAAVPATTPDLD